MESKYNFYFFNERLRWLMDRSGLLQSKLATEANINAPQISKWLKGTTKKVNRENAKKLADYFKCDYSWIREGAGEPYPAPADETAEKKGIFATNRAKKQQDDSLAEMRRVLFKSQCPGMLDEFFDFIGDHYGDTREGVELFLEDYKNNMSHTHYRTWLSEQEKKSEMPNTETGGRSNLTVNGS